MKLRLFLLLLSLLPFTSPVHGANVINKVTSLFKRGANERAYPPTIRVRVAHNIEGANLAVNGTYTLFDPLTGRDFMTRFKGKKRYLQALSDGLKWGETFPGTYQLLIFPEDSYTVTMVDDREYPGLMYIYEFRDAGSLSLVNKLYIEDYVRAILSKPENSSLHPEALAALAIVERTNALYQSMNPKNKFWDVDSEKVGYIGNPYPREGEEPINYREIDRAIDVTRYMIMSQTGVYEKQATPFPAILSSGSNGAASSNAQHSQISLEEADQMAKSGAHAAQILGRAFPGTTIMLIDRKP